MTETVMQHITATLGSDDAMELIVKFAEITSYQFESLSLDQKEAINLDIANRKNHAIRDAEELSQYSKYNKVLNEFIRSPYLYLGQSFAAVNLYNMHTNKVESFRVLSNTVPKDVIEFLITLGKVTKKELQLPKVDSSEHSSSITSYLKLLRLLTKRNISFDTTKYYGVGPAGCALTEEQTKHIESTFGFDFRKSK
jgi:hypothetical protein